MVRNTDNLLKVFSWSLTETADPFGNLTQYAYEREPSPNDGSHHWDQIYLQTIRYVDYGAKSAPQFLITVAFVYEARPDNAAPLSRQSPPQRLHSMPLTYTESWNAASATIRLFEQVLHWLDAQKNY